MSPILCFPGVDVDEDLESGFAESMDQQGTYILHVHVHVHVHNYLVYIYVHVHVHVHTKDSFAVFLGTCTCT